MLTHGWVIITCIGKEAIQFQDRACFKAFVIQLFGFHVKPHNMQWMEELAGILLLYYTEVFREYPSHSVIIHMHAAARTCMDSSVIVEVKLKEWSAACRKWFIAKNGMFTAITTAEGEEMIPYQSFYDYTQRQGRVSQHISNSLLLQESNGSELLHLVSTLSTTLQTVVQELQVIKSELARLKEVQSSSSPNIPMSSDMSTTVTDKPTRKRNRESRQSTIPERYQQLLQTPITTTTKGSVRPNLLANDMKNISLTTLWCDWFYNKLYDSDFKDLPTTDRHEAKSKLKKAARLIFFMKLFQNDEVVIDKCPENNDAKLLWRVHIRTIGSTLQDRLLAFLKTQFESKEVFGTVTKTQQQLFGLACDGVLDELTTERVKDNATCDAWNYKTLGELKLQQQSEETKRKRAKTLAFKKAQDGK